MIPPSLMYEMAKAYQAEWERSVCCLSRHDSVNRQRLVPAGPVVVQNQ